MVSPGLGVPRALFQGQQAVDTENLKHYALELGLNAAAFDICLDSGSKAARALADLQVGQDDGVSGAPAFS